MSCRGGEGGRVSGKGGMSGRVLWRSGRVSSRGDKGGRVSWRNGSVQQRR